MRTHIKEVYKDNVGAIDDLTNAIKINQNFAEAYYKRGAIQFKMNDFEGANPDLEIALSLGFSRAKNMLEKILRTSPLSTTSIS